MARLNEILGGILKDVTVARLTADLQAKDLYAAYQEHPLLARMPVPRVTVREVSLRLRFAIAENAEPDYTKVDLSGLTRDWTTRLQRDILPRVFQAAAGKALDPKVAARLAAEIGGTAKSLSLAKALSGDTDALVSASARQVAATRERLPVEDRRGLPGATALRAAAVAQVQREVEAFLPVARRQLAATAAAEMDLQVLVRKADLAEVDESRMQEVTLTLASDDIQLAAPSVGPGDAGR
jgi:hypothetical protein